MAFFYVFQFSLPETLPPDMGPCTQREALHVTGRLALGAVGASCVGAEVVP